MVPNVTMSSVVAICHDVNDVVMIFQYISLSSRKIWLADGRYIDRFLSHKFWSLINIVCPSKQYCRRFPDIIKCIFFNENLFSLIIFSLKSIPYGPVDNESELVHWAITWPNTDQHLCRVMTLWHHQMETFSALLDLCEGNTPVTCGFPSQRPVTRSFDVFFDVRLNKRMRKQSRRR